jgi:hypothetical protein
MSKRRFGTGQASGGGVSRGNVLSRLTDEQRQKCAICGAIKWFHEPERTMLPNHKFTAREIEVKV